MPRKPIGVSEDELNMLLDKGYAHPLIESRLIYAEVNQLLTHYLTQLEGVDVIHPRMLPIQATGRWSTSDPPIGNFSKDKKYGPDGIQDVVVPFAGTKWDVWDKEAVEGRLVSYDCNDTMDIESFERNYDIHTLTACGMFKWPLPPFEPTKGVMFSDAGKEWCLDIGSRIHASNCRLVGHAGCSYLPWSDDTRERTLAKNCRYSLCYELVKSRGAAMRRYAYELKMDPDVLQETGCKYLDSKPGFVLYKRQWQNTYVQSGVSRSLLLGRRRLLAGTPDKRAKEGLNHRIQGSVVDMTNADLIAIHAEWDDVLLKVNKHDGFKLESPETLATQPRLKQIVEGRTWMIGGRTVSFPCSWKVIHSPEQGGS